MAKQIAPYQAAVSVNNEILYRASSIAYEAGRLSLSPLQGKDQDVLVKEVKACLALEGIKLTPSQSRALAREEDLPAIPEARALLGLFKKMNRIDPYDPAFLEEFEREMFPSGVPVRLSRRVPSFPYPIPLHAKVPGMIKGFYAFAGRGKERHPLLLAPLFFFEMNALQPYRLYSLTLGLYLMKAVLVSYEKSFQNAAIVADFASRADELRAAYRQTVETADTAPFVLAALTVFEKAILDAEKKALRTRNRGTALVDKLLSRMEEGRFYSATELLALLGLNSRLGLAKNYLRPALEAGRIERSNPLTPTDRNQRYRKVQQ